MFSSIYRRGNIKSKTGNFRCMPVVSQLREDVCATERSVVILLLCESCWNKVFQQQQHVIPFVTIFLLCGILCIIHNLSACWKALVVLSLNESLIFLGSFVGYVFLSSVQFESASNPLFSHEYQMGRIHLLLLLVLSNLLEWPQVRNEIAVQNFLLFYFIAHS